MKRKMCIQYSSDRFYINMCDFGATPEPVMFLDWDSQIGVHEGTFLLVRDAISLIK
jgi:hypothetical protein